MARFVYWPSCQQIPNHELSVPAGSTGTISNVAVAECGDDLYVQLVNADGWCKVWVLKPGAKPG